MDSKCEFCHQTFEFNSGFHRYCPPCDELLQAMSLTDTGDLLADSAARDPQAEWVPLEPGQDPVQYTIVTTFSVPQPRPGVVGRSP